MTNSIPASELVSVIPSVLGAGGSPLSLNGVFLSADPSIPPGTVMPFSNLAGVQAWFGASAIESLLAAVYFGGFTGAETLPGTIYFTQYNAAAVAGYLRSASFAGVPLTTIQALSGNLIVSVDGETVTSAAINLSGATSYSNAAALIQAGLETAGGTFSGTATSAANVVTVATVVSGSLHVGDIIVGAGFGANCTITSFGTGTGGTGTYNVSTSQTVGSAVAITVSSAVTVTYDSLRAAFVVSSATTGANSSVGFATGSLAISLKLTSATGAVRSAGAIAATPAGVMNAVVAVTQNWATFMTCFEPVLDTKLAFATWVNTTNPTQRFMYVCWDSDVTAKQANQAGTFGALTATYNGVMPVFDATGYIAAFICGTTASIDFEETQGRITFAYKGQAGLVPVVTDATTADNLEGNGYNFYGAYATANDAFQFLQPGLVSGDWSYADEYVNQIQLNNALQLALLELLVNVKSLPYNNQGYAMIRAACLDPINAALNFGSMQPGVALSAAQVQEVNTAAGAVIAPTLAQAGWYLQILPATALTRASRGSPPCTLWYMSGGSIQRISLASIDVL